MSNRGVRLLVCLSVMVGAGCNGEEPAADSAVPDATPAEASVDADKTPDAPPGDSKIVPDVGQDQAKGDGPTADMTKKPDGPIKADSGPVPKIKGRIRLFEMQDVRLNTVPKPSVLVAFADLCFYDETFVSTKKYGDCHVGMVMPPPPCITNYVDGGPVIITGGDYGLAYKYKAKGPYGGNLPSSIHTVFSNGQTLNITGGGSAKVPVKFKATLKAPSDLKVSVPSMTGATATVSTKSSWTVKWTKGLAKEVRVRLRCVSGSSTTPAMAVECSSKDDGDIVIKAGALADMALGCKGKIDIDVERANEVAIPNAKAQITARAATQQTTGLILK